MTLEILERDMKQAWKVGLIFKKNVLANMIDVVKKASMTAKGRVEITEELVNETLQKYQKTVQEQYDTCPTGEEYVDRKDYYLQELALVKEYAPQLMSDYNEIKDAIVTLLSEHGAEDALSSRSNRGTIMKIVAPAMKGRADMTVVNKVVGDLLA